MRISANLCQQKNTLINVGSINRSLHRKNPDAKESSGNSVGLNVDRVSISSESKIMSRVESLTKQKESITDKKNELIKKTLERGGSTKDIQAMVSLYEQQVKDIDKQISELYGQQAKEAVEESQKQKNSSSSTENKTDEQLVIEQFGTLASASENIKQTEKVSAIKESVEGRAKVKTAEVLMGGIHIDMLESKGITGDIEVADMIANEQSALDRKVADIHQLEAEALNLGSIQAETLNEAIEKLEEQEDKAAQDKKSDSDDNDKMSFANAKNADSSDNYNPVNKNSTVDESDISDESGTSDKNPAADKYAPEQTLL